MLIVVLLIYHDNYNTYDDYQVFLIKHLLITTNILMLLIYNGYQVLLIEDIC